MEFVHLHVHSQYSLLDGTADPKVLAKKASARGMSALALTDSGNMYGAVAFYKACKGEKIRPILGAELFVEDGLGARPGEHPPAFQLIALVENETGYRNLCKLITQAIFDGMHYQPRVQMEALRAHHEGLIFLSGGLRGAFGAPFLLGRPEVARQRLQSLGTFLDTQHFYLELQDLGIEGGDVVQEGVRRLAAESGYELVVTNAVHYIDAEDSAIHEVLNAIARGCSMSDERRIVCPTDQAWLKTPEEMLELFPDDVEALERTARIAERCRVPLRLLHLPLPGHHPPRHLRRRRHR